MASIGQSYAAARIAPRDPEATLEDFFINRFGDRLYRTFFRDYTEKVWGVSCDQISAEWGAQRVKGLSVTKAILHAARQVVKRDQSASQRGTETSLIERFLYPRLGLGQMWEEVTRRIRAQGGHVTLDHSVVALDVDASPVRRVCLRDRASGESRWVACDAFFSSVPVRQLVEQLQPDDEEIARIASLLPYRDFMTAGLVVRRMSGATPRDN